MKVANIIDLINNVDTSLNLFRDDILLGIDSWCSDLAINHYDDTVISYTAADNGLTLNINLK